MSKVRLVVIQNCTLTPGLLPDETIDIFALPPYNKMNVRFLYRPDENITQKKGVHMPKVSQEHQESRKTQIIEAAVRCISRKGFHQTSMQDIVAESGLSPGAIYLYFESKEEIIKTIADMRHARERKVIAEAFLSGDRGIALNQLVESFFNALADRDVRVERSIEVQLWGEALCNPRVREIARQGMKETRAAFVEALTAYQKRGMLSPDLSADAVARAMIAQFHGFVLQIALDDDLDINEHVKVIKSWISGPASWGGKQSKRRGMNTTGNDPSVGTAT